MDDLAALMLQIEWGADEALAEHPLDRRSERPLRPVPLRPVPPRPVLPSPASPPSVPSPAEMAWPRAPAPLLRAQALADAAADLPSLRAAVAAFDGCALRTTATNLVFGQGDPSAPVTLVADVPGAAEDRAGTPFAGAGGDFLDRMLHSVGLTRTEIYACSLLPWRPPGDRRPADAEVQLCLPFLLRHLVLVRPRRLVLFGALAGRTLLPGGATRRPHGIWHALTIPGLPNPVPALALGSPAAILASPLAKRNAWADLLRLRRALDEDATNG